MDQQYQPDEVQAATGADEVEYLGTGSFGETWRVKVDGTDAAFKILHREGYSSERLDREVEGLERVDSPHVVGYDGQRQVEIHGSRRPCLVFESAGARTAPRA